MKVTITREIKRDLWCDGVQREAELEEFLCAYPYAPKDIIRWTGYIPAELGDMAKAIPCDIGTDPNAPTLYDIIWEADGMMTNDVLPRLVSAMIYTKRNRQSLAKEYNSDWCHVETLLFFMGDYLRACGTIIDGTINTNK